MLKYALGFFAVLAVALGLFLMYGQQEIKAMMINEVDLAQKADGAYRGSFARGRWRYDVRVVVKNHKIMEITVADSPAQRDPRSQKINAEQTGRVIDGQSLKVDVVSGATVNSKALLKAIENALGGTPE